MKRHIYYMKAIFKFFSSMVRPRDLLIVDSLYILLCVLVGFVSKNKKFRSPLSYYLPWQPGTVYSSSIVKLHKKKTKTDCREGVKLGEEGVRYQYGKSSTSRSPYRDRWKGPYWFIGYGLVQCFCLHFRYTAYGPVRRDSENNLDTPFYGRRRS